MSSKFLRCALAVAHEIFSAAKDLGWHTWVLSAAGVSLLAGWALLKQLNGALVALISATLFCFLIVALAVARLFWREWKRYPDYEAWDNVTDLRIWQAACLWAGEQPYNSIPAHTKAYPYLQMLKVEVDMLRLRVTDYDEDAGLMWALVSRHELASLAVRLKKRPAFLFPDAR